MQMKTAFHFQFLFIFLQILYGMFLRSLPGLRSRKLSLLLYVLINILKVYYMPKTWNLLAYILICYNYLENMSENQSHGTYMATNLDVFGSSNH